MELQISTHKIIPNHIKRNQIWELYVNEVRKLKSIHTLQKVS